MKRTLLSAGLTLVLVGTGSSVAWSDVATVSEQNLAEIVELQPGVSPEEMAEAVADYAASDGLTEEAASQVVLAELRHQEELAEEEAEETGPSEGEVGTMSVGKGAHKLSAAKRKGDVFYTPNTIKTGHVGIFHTKDNIVESIPGTPVQKIHRNRRLVYNNAVMQYVKTTQTKRNSAANWANSRVGKDKYSANFATNRKTGHYGAKNCSKLVWSAYLLKAKLDVDANKGAGVYPRDMRDSSHTVTYKTIKV
ncbi:hypothetical protein GCM10007079_14480 [Nocardiopsis terrae]|uniref:Uncharacterized protein YycO n=1 Tax=Nocardiopsis terrae TaxID=372655 RepID=A0ABR9HBF0_9ACTN|nr:hypothetical protein [Nocardiopsis terrae]MBE1456349.1 uncharacterized protein YycO [Nocardiopsis terrae]GHC77360.1 hypothetical protein GCM10007079_14480 [Nocardiopsis terrae]